jgi:hypothetical protein
MLSLAMRRIAALLGASGVAGRFTPHTNLVWEPSTGGDRIVSFFEAVEYQATGRFAVDLSGRHFRPPGGPNDDPIVFSVTVNLGHAR